MATCVVCQTAATVYCENDKAFLCGDCDHKIHTASVVAARHTRFRLCELCNSMAATVYCRNDKVHLCDDCDAEVHQNNPLSATHTIVPAQPLGAEQSQPAPTLASGCNHPHHHASKEGGGCVAEAHSETAKVAALCPDADAVTTSHGNSDAVVPVVVMEEHGDEAAFLSLPTQQHQQPQLDDAGAYGKGAGDVMDAKPWAKDAFDALELDGGWLDRLEMGFDFSDILDNHNPAPPCDDAGLVPTLAPSSAAFPSDSFPGVVSEGGSSSLKRSATFDLDDLMPSLKVPFSGPPSSPPSSYHFDFSLPNDLPETSSQAPQEQAAAEPSAAPVVPRAVLASAEVTSPAVAAAHVSAHAAAGAMTHPVLTREQRVQRYREKRSRRNFEKTIRYASRKAYAEVRPRIKGRFARKEEVLAWKAANPGLAVPEILG